MNEVINMYQDKVMQLCSDYAAIAHRGQLRKDKITPYITHPGRVACIVSTTDCWMLRFIPIAAAWLHDVMEDCATDQLEEEGYSFIIANHRTRNRDIRIFLLENKDIKKEDGEQILELVKALTISQDKTIPKKIRKAEYLKKIQIAEPVVSILKYCDRIDNLTTVQHFSKGGFKYYLEDTQILINSLADRIHYPAPELHKRLENKLKEVKKIYEEMYE